MKVVCKCGSELFFENLWCWGWWKRLITSTGEVEETNLDELNYRAPPKTVRCVECGKRNPNPNS